MKIVKGIALGLIGFFLFISLPCLGLFITLNSTLLNPDFAVNEVEKLDISKVAQEYFEAQLPPGDLVYASAIDDTIIQEKLWINQNINQSIINLYSYLLGDSSKLQFSYSLVEVKQSLINNITNSILISPPPEYLGLSPQDKDKYLANLKQSIQDIIPSNYTLDVNQDLIGLDNMIVLGQIKEGIRYLRASLWILIGFILILILLIFLIQRKIKGTSRVLGIIFLIDGVLCGIAYIVLKLIIPLSIPPTGMYTQVSAWIKLLVSDLLSPFGLFSLAILVIGVICLTASILIKDKRIDSPEVNVNS